MNAPVIGQAYLIAADFLVLLSFILGLYVIALNPRHMINRLVGFIILLLAMANLGVVLSLRAEDVNGVQLPAALIAAFVPVIFPAILAASLMLLAPEWFSGKRRGLVFPFLLLFTASILLTAGDLVFGTRWYYTGVPAGYTGGPLDAEMLIGGLAGEFVMWANIHITPVLSLLLLALVSFIHRSAGDSKRNLARLLLGMQVFTAAAHFALPVILLPGVAVLLITSVYVLLFTFLAFQQLISERKLQSGRLRTRLTALALIVTLPTFIFLAASANSQTRQTLVDNANDRLADAANNTATSLQVWLDQQARALQATSILPGMDTVNPQVHQTALTGLQRAYPYIYLFATADITGQNIARTDGLELRSFKGQAWFDSVLRRGTMITAVLPGATAATSTLVIATPIRTADGAIGGVIMGAGRLGELSRQFSVPLVGRTGYVYVVDAADNLTFHPRLEGGLLGLKEAGLISPVEALRNGANGEFNYQDAAGERWYSYLLRMPNGWGVIAQQQEAELLEIASEYQRTNWALLVAGSLILLVLVGATMRQAFQPIQSLTETAHAIIQGNLKHTAVVEGDDEIGQLAQSFNAMTAQLGDLIDGLEQRVAERTSDLERRTAQLQAATEVGRAVASIHDLDQLLHVVTRLISESFGFYHTGIFLVDDQNEYAVLRAANSPGGQRMLERRHRLKIGQQGIVGYVTQRREPRIALNVGQDAAHASNPDLPETRSEMALPLVVGGRLLGALDVQSTRGNAFSPQDVETLQVLADQVAIAISNAYLVAQTRQLLESERRAYRQVTRAGWQQFFTVQQIPAVVRDRDGLHVIHAEHSDMAINHAGSKDNPADQQVLVTPLMVRNEKIGVLRTRKPDRRGAWTADEIELLNKLAGQLGAAVDSARVYQETHMRAEQERISAEVTANIRKSLDMDTLLKNTVQEVQRALGVPQVLVQLSPAPGVVPEGSGNGNHNWKNGSISDGTTGNS